MQPQYLVGIKKKNFIRMSDGRELIGGSLTLAEAKEAKKIYKKSRIFKLVEVKNEN